MDGNTDDRNSSPSKLLKAPHLHPAALPESDSPAAPVPQTIGQETATGSGSVSPLLHGGDQGQYDGLLILEAALASQPNDQSQELYDGTQHPSNGMSPLSGQNQDFFDDSIPVGPLVDESTSISVLRAEYEHGSAAFVKQIDWLASKGFDSIRRTRGDGNCFYRSIAFAYVERILYAAEPEAAFVAILALNSTIPMLEAAGFKETYKEFYYALVSLLQQIANLDNHDEKLTSEKLLEAFQDDSVSNYVVYFLRLLTSAQIRCDPGGYESFLLNPESHDVILPEDFCRNFIEVMDKEADHVQIVALTNALKICVDIAYLDGKSTERTVELHSFVPDGCERESNPLQLLYRPGHYDILVRSGKGKQRLK